MKKQKTFKRITIPVAVILCICIIFGGTYAMGQPYDGLSYQDLLQSSRTDPTKLPGYIPPDKPEDVPTDWQALLGDSDRDPKPHTPNPDLATREGVSYEDVAKAFSAFAFSGGYRDDGFHFLGFGGAVMEDAAASAPMPAPEAPAGDFVVNDTAMDVPEAEKSDYSGTNVQVEGIDEGDIVKTDGEYIYVLSGDTVKIVDAAGRNTKKISSFQVGKGNRDEKGYQYYEYPSELYVDGDRLMVVLSVSEYADRSHLKMAVKPVEYSERTEIVVYDISDRAMPRKLTTAGQDGYYLTSRLTGGTLYLLTSYSVRSFDKEDPETYIPYLYRGGEDELVASSDICMVETPRFAGYTVISAIDVNSGNILSNRSVAGGGNTVYMNYENLYLTRTVYDTQISDPIEEGPYIVETYKETSCTEILRFELNDGALYLAAEGKVPGTLLNQFSMDEYDDHFRVVTTVNDYSYTSYTDEAHGWVNYEWSDDVTTNALFVLDMDLNKTGSVEGLGADERVYSVRFTGDIGYFVTFRETDPLFAVDLSDPNAPQVLSALKIPGFSQYLHPFADGRLLGLGMDADEETGWTKTMKLSMFDTSDPADVREKSTLLLDSYWSVALNNHKAILVSAEKDLIAFPTEEEYVIFGYSEEQGFYQRGTFSIQCDDWWYLMSNARGMYIDDYVYICNPNLVAVFDLTDLSPVMQLDI
ncbi:MAG: beta-propeller domain-containing protein [Firmicutes bacterium]|nr:beta-propeller domain-containing protein [Bacillota bacterium]